MALRVITGKTYSIDGGLEKTPSGPWFVVGRGEIPLRVDETLDWHTPGLTEPTFSATNAFIVVKAVQGLSGWYGVAGECEFIPQFAVHQIIEEGNGFRPRAVRGWSYETPSTLMQVGDFGLEGQLGDFLISENGPRPSRVDVSMGWNMPIDAEPVFLRVSSGIGWSTELVGGSWIHANTWPGTGYSSAPAISFVGGGGTGAQASASIFGGALENVRITNGGSGYTSAPDVVFSGGGPLMTASAVATVSGGKVVEVSWEPSYEVPLFMLTHVWTWVEDTGGGGGGGGGTSGTSGTSGNGTGGGGGGDIQLVPNAGLQFAGTEGTAGTAGTYGTSAVMTIYNTTLDPGTTMAVPVGGIPAGTTADDLNNFNMVELWDYLLFPTLPPTYTIPTISLSSSITGIKEVGEIISPALSVNGIKNDAGDYTELSIRKNGTEITQTIAPSVSSASPVPPQFGYADPNNPNQSYGHTYTDANVEVQPMSGTNPSTITYLGLGNYNSGLPKQDSKGAFDGRTPLVRNANAPQKFDGNYQSNTQVISGYYPYFYGVTSSQSTAAAVQALINAGSYLGKTVASGGGSISLAYNATAKWLWFAVYSGYPDKAKWEELGNPLNNGLIGTGGTFTNLFAGPVTLNCNSYPSGTLWTGVPYKIYVAQKITDISTCIVKP